MDGDRCGLGLNTSLSSLQNDSEVWTQLVWVIFVFDRADILQTHLCSCIQCLWSGSEAGIVSFPAILFHYCVVIFAPFFSPVLLNLFCINCISLNCSVLNRELASISEEPTMALQKCSTQANAEVHFNAATKCVFWCLIKNHFRNKGDANDVCYYMVNNWFWECWLGLEAWFWNKREKRGKTSPPLIGCIVRVALNCISKKFWIIKEFKLTLEVGILSWNNLKPFQNFLSL